jgi:hypothetical protein
MDELKATLQRRRQFHGLTFNRIVPKLLSRYFEKRDDGRYYQERVENELRNVRETSEKRKRIAEERWAEARKTNTCGMQKQCYSHSHSHSDSQSNIDIKARKKNSRKAKNVPLPEGWRPPPRASTLANSLKVDLQETEARFRDYLASHGKQYSDYDAAFYALKFNGKENGLSGQRQFQDDKLSVSRAADRLIDATREGKLTFAPRPSLVPDSGESNIRLLPKG